MSQTSPRLDLPYIMPAQAQKHVTVNEAIRRLDALVQISVRSRTAEDPPGSPGEGEAWIVPGDPWDGFAPGEIAAFQDGAWARLAPKPGWLAWCEDEQSLLVHDGEGWRNALSLDDLDRLGVGTGADEANPFAAKLNSALWTARETGEGGTGDLRYVMNKQGAADTVSLILQSGWQGRAEMGLAGEDDFSIKVSADGQDWTEALRIDRQTGAVSAQGAGLIHRGNMVGAVSHEDGAPTGAVIESGETPDGAYVRFADGLQICTASLTDLGPVETAHGALHRSASQGAGDYPAPFTRLDYAGLQVFRNPGQVDGWASFNSPPTLTRWTNFTIFAATANAQANYEAHFIAVGRWR